MHLVEVYYCPKTDNLLHPIYCLKLDFSKATLYSKSSLHGIAINDSGTTRKITWVKDSQFLATEENLV